MKKRDFWKKRIFFIAIFALAIVVTACNGKETGKETLKQKEGGTEKNAGTDKEYCYQASFQELSVKSTRFENMCQLEDKVYTIGSYYEEDKKTGEYSTHYCLLEGALDGSGFKETELKVKKDEYIQLMTVDENNQLSILTLISSYNEKTEETKEQYYIKKLEKDGTIKKDHKIQMEKDMNGLYLGGRGTMLAKDGSVYASDYNSFVYYFDKTGKQKQCFDLKAMVDNIIQTEDGSIYVYGDLGEERESALKKLDLEQQKFGSAIHMDISHVYNTNSYGGKDIYLQEDTGVYHIDVSSGKTELLFNWINQDIDGQRIQSYLPLEDGSVLAIVASFNQQNEKEKAEIVVIKKVKSSEVKEKTILTLACTYLVDSVKKAVLDFNKTNETYRIEVQEYSNYEDSASKLNLDMISGQVPDIISLYQLPANMYIKKGILTDLYPLMEKDTEVKKEDFLESVLNTLEQDKRLYYINSTLSLDVWSVGEKYWKEEGWNFKEMEELYHKKSKDQLFFYYVYREDILRKLILGQMDDLIDWKTGEVHINTENFINMLEFSKNFPSAEEAEISDIDLGKAVKKGNIMLMDNFIYNAYDMEVQAEFYKNAGGFHMVSYPSEDRNNRVAMNAFSFTPLMAITEQCKNKEGAWEFLRKSLTYDGMLSLVYDPEGYGSGIPTRKDVLEKLLEYSMATEEYEDNGVKVVPIETSYSFNSYGIPIGPISEEQADQIRNLVNRIGIFNAEENTITTAILDIVNEETAAMYAGDKTAEQAAEIIQSRVKTLVSENS